MPSVATAIDIARLYEELRECVRANDQEGVKRVFSELVAARRPVAEILAEVKSLTKERETAETKATAEAKAKGSFTREWPVMTASSQIRPNAPTQPRRDFAPTSEPSPAPQDRAPAAPIDTPAITTTSLPPAQPSWRQPAALATPSAVTPPSVPEPTPSAVAPPSVPEPTPSVIAPPPSAPEPTASIAEPARVVPQSALSPAVAPQSPQEPATLRADAGPARVATTNEPARVPSLGAGIGGVPSQNQAPASSPVVARASETSSPAEPISTPVEQSPAPSAPPVAEPPVSAPNRTDLREILRSASGVTAAPSGHQPVSQPIDHATTQSAPAATEYTAAEPAPMPRRATSFGVASDAPAAPVAAEAPARRNPIAIIAIAGVAVAAIAGGGWFALSQRGPEPAASHAAPAQEAAAPTTTEKSPPPATTSPAPAPTKKPPAAPATTAAREPATAAAPPAGPAPAPAPSASTAMPAAPQNAAVPDKASTQKPEAAPGVAKLEAPKEPGANVTPTPDPATTAVAKPAPSPEPRLSAAETAALLSRGDAAFSVGDVASARLFYERAADAGNGDAALRLGESYDPNFLEQAKLRAIKGDSKAAAFWYLRAKELGIAEADILLKGIQTK